MWQCFSPCMPWNSCHDTLQHHICNSLNVDRTIFNNLLFACARLVAALLYYSTLLTSHASDSVLTTSTLSTQTLSSIIDRARKQAERPIEYRPQPLSVVHIVCFRHSAHCAVSNGKGILSADHWPYACGATYDRRGGQLCLYKPGHVFTAV